MRQLSLVVSHSHACSKALQSEFAHSGHEFLSASLNWLDRLKVPRSEVEGKMNLKFKILDSPKRLKQKVVMTSERFVKEFELETQAKSCHDVRKIC